MKLHKWFVLNEQVPCRGNGSTFAAATRGCTTQSDSCTSVEADDLPPDGSHRNPDGKVENDEDQSQPVPVLLGHILPSEEHWRLRRGVRRQRGEEVRDHS